MFKKPPNVKWIIAESDAEWDHLSNMSLSTNPRNQRRSRSRWAIASLFLLIVGISSSVWFPEEGDLNSSIATEVTMVQPPFNAMPQRYTLLANRVRSDVQAAAQNEGLTDDTVASRDVKLTYLELLGQHAVLSVNLEADEHPTSYRQTLFYRHTAEGWYPTLPADDLWGPARSLETSNFIFYFRLTKIE